MNKSELCDAIAEHANLTKTDANRALDGLLKTIGTNPGIWKPRNVDRFWLLRG